MNTRIRFSGMKKLAPFARAHLENRRGTDWQAYDYATKNETRVAGRFYLGCFYKEM